MDSGCRLCRNATPAQVADVDGLMLRGLSIPRIAEKTGRSRTAIFIHRGHLAPEMLARIKKPNRIMHVKHFRATITAKQRIEGIGPRTAFCEAESLFAVACAGRDVNVIRREIPITDVQREMLDALFGRGYSETIAAFRLQVLAEFDSLVARSSAEVREEIERRRGILSAQYQHKYHVERSIGRAVVARPEDDWSYV